MKPPQSIAVGGVAMNIVLSLITCGVWALIWQSRLFDISNALNEETRYKFWPWLLLSIITCGIYNIYTQYQLGLSLNAGLEKAGGRSQENLSMLAIIFSLFGLITVVHAIEQDAINKLYA